MLKRLKIFFVGPETPDETADRNTNVACQYCIAKDRMRTFIYHSSPYHDFALTADASNNRPDLIVALNTGMSEVETESWKRTIGVIRDLDVPGVFTAYTKLEAESEIRMLKGMGVGINKGLALNKWKGVVPTTNNYLNADEDGPIASYNSYYRYRAIFPRRGFTASLISIISKPTSYDSEDYSATNSRAPLPIAMDATQKSLVSTPGSNPGGPPSDFPVMRAEDLHLTHLLQSMNLREPASNFRPEIAGTSEMMKEPSPTMDNRQIGGPQNMAENTNPRMTGGTPYMMMDMGEMGGGMGGGIPGSMTVGNNLMMGDIGAGMGGMGGPEGMTQPGNLEAEIAAIPQHLVLKVKQDAGVEGKDNLTIEEKRRVVQTYRVRYTGKPGDGRPGEVPGGTAPSPSLLETPLQQNQLPQQQSIPDMFSADFMSSVASQLEADFDSQLFRPEGDINFERDFGQWFNHPDDVTLDMK
ncbi:hypothetical protein V5O48_012258 [Marasmius crinis-equi]|uniref:Mitochondrial splicing suppressor 51-like C-terminal domain-containing protein n=1 Tax=Marasmius crinis-equi TaxID=585013 RepID=A0ABR3F3R8_9AGAR